MKKNLLLLLILSWSWTGCKVLMPVDLSMIPMDQREIFIHNFSNDTFHSDVNNDLFDAFRSEGLRRGSFKIVDEQEAADYLIYGDVSMYRKEGRMFDNYSNPTRYELIVICKIVMKENRKDGVNLFRQEFQERMDYSESEGYAESEFSARRRLFLRLSSRVHRFMEETVRSRYSNS